MQTSEHIDIQKVYNKYFRIDHSSHYEKLNFYRRYIDSIQRLPERLRIEIELDYNFSQFEIGHFELFLSTVDDYIETVMQDNIHMVQGEDIFSKLLFHKAASLYNVGNVQQSLVIVSQLCRMQPKNKKYALLCRKCLHILQNKSYDWLKATSIGLITLSLLMTIVGFLWLEDLDSEAKYQFGILKNIMFYGSLSSLAIYEILIKLGIRKKYKAILNESF